MDEVVYEEELGVVAQVVQFYKNLYQELKE